MDLVSTPTVARRSAEPRRRRGTCSKPAPRAAIAEAPAERPQAPVAEAPAKRARARITAARRSRLDDAIVTQWLLEQVPSEHRHPVLASDPL